MHRQQKYRRRVAALIGVLIGSIPWLALWLFRWLHIDANLDWLALTLGLPGFLIGGVLLPSFRIIADHFVVWWVLNAGFFALVVIVLDALWRRRLLRRSNGPKCDHCGYDLTGNVTGVCPECGASGIRGHADPRKKRSDR